MTTLAGGFLVTNYHDARRKVSESNLDQGRKQKRPLPQTAVDPWRGWSLKFYFVSFLSDKTIEKSISFSSRERPKNQKRLPKLITWVLNWIGRKQRNRRLSISARQLVTKNPPDRVVMYRCTRCTLSATILLKLVDLYLITFRFPQ